MSRIALIGAGRMGGALLSGWIASGTKPSDVLIIDPKPGTDAAAAIKAGAIHAKALSAKNVRGLETLILAIKPQMFDALAADIAMPLPQKTCVISILAGTTQGGLSDAFGERAIIRAMPNTPAAIGQGITAFHRNKYVNDKHAAEAHVLLSAGGDVIEVAEESLIDVVTAVSGSGPAYVFHMVEALEAAAIRAGMPEDLAKRLARKTITGAGALLDESEETATQLRQAVTSPNGTTQAALEVLMAEDGLPPLMRKTVAAAIKKSKELGV